MNGRRLLGLGTVPLAFAAGSAGLHAWLREAPPSIATDLAQPLPVVTSWHGYGAVAFAILAATLLAATGALVAVVRRHAADARAGDGWVVAAVAGAALLGAGAAPVVFSSDVYAYAAYGSLALRGDDPYAAVPVALHGPFLDAARWQWSGPFPRCVYGPLFVAAAREGVAALQGLGVAATLAAFRFAAGAAFVASIALLDVALRDLRPAARFTAVCVYGLNPVAIWTVAEGHNDAFLMLAATTAAALAARGGRTAGALILGMSPILKASGVLLAALAALDAAAFRRPEWRAGLTGLAAGTLLAVALAVPPLVPALGALGSHGHYAPAVSVQGLLGPGPSLVLAAAMLLGGTGLVVRGRRSGYGWIGLAVLAALPNPYPWYAPWLIPIALAAGPGASGVALWAATISSAARYLPDAVGTLDDGTARLASLVAASPLLWALAAAIRSTLTRQKAVAQP